MQTIEGLRIFKLWPVPAVLHERETGIGDEFGDTSPDTLGRGRIVGRPYHLGRRTDRGPLGLGQIIPQANVRLLQHQDVRQGPRESSPPAFGRQ